MSREKHQIQTEENFVSLKGFRVSRFQVYTKKNENFMEQSFNYATH